MIILEVHRPIWPQPSVSAHIRTPEVLLNIFKCSLRHTQLWGHFLKSKYSKFSQERLLVNLPDRINSFSKFLILGLILLCWVSETGSHCLDYIGLEITTEDKQDASFWQPSTVMKIQEWVICPVHFAELQRHAECHCFNSTLPTAIKVF